jgi:hypothetical protein
MGHGDQLDAMDVIDFAAVAGARGLEGTAIQELMRQMQANAMQASLASVHDVLDAVRKANQARINTIIANVRGLDAIPYPMQQTGWRAALNMAPVGQYAAVAYVNRAEVLSILASALVENPAT